MWIWFSLDFVFFFYVFSIYFYLGRFNWSILVIILFWRDKKKNNLDWFKWFHSQPMCFSFWDFYGWWWWIYDCYAWSYQKLFSDVCEKDLNCCFDVDRTLCYVIVSFFNMIQLIKLYLRCKVKEEILKKEIW